ncbi:protein furry [Diaphorina citri]|uniref:Protein furry n=1 Tax=Diaphorina citri TaxID=121845 RepID=A0A3Q0ITZ4_DIACI|nr:protein furry [Diaphorina citri]
MYTRIVNIYQYVRLKNDNPSVGGGGSVMGDSESRSDVTDGSSQVTSRTDCDTPDSSVTVLPWAGGQRGGRAATCGTAADSSNNVRPGEYVMRSLFADFTAQAEKKLDQVLAEPQEKPLSKVLQRGEDPVFDQLLIAFGSVAEHCLPSILRALFAWYERQMRPSVEAAASLSDSAKKTPENRGKGLFSGDPVETKEAETILQERRDLAVEFVFCLILIEVLKQLPFHPGHDNLVTYIETVAFKHFKYREGIQNDPNATNIHTVADLYAEVLGVLAQSRFQSVRKRFMSELKELRFKEPNTHTTQSIISLLMGMKFFRVKMVPIEEFEASFQFMQECAQYFTDVKDKDVKHALAGLFVEILVPVAATVKNEEPDEMITGERKPRIDLLPVWLLFHALYPHNHWANRKPDEMITGERKPRIDLLPVWLLYHEPDEMITGERKPRIDLFRTCVAAEPDEMITGERKPRIDLFAMNYETVYDKTLRATSVAKWVSHLACISEEPDEMITGERKPRIDLFRTCVAAVPRLIPEPGEMITGERKPRIVLFRTCVAAEPDEMITDERKPRIDLLPVWLLYHEPDEMITGERKPRIDLFRTCVAAEPDEMITGERKPRIDLFRTCVAAEPDEMITGERKPRIDLFRTCVAAVPRLIPDAMTGGELVDLLSRLTLHMDEELRALAYQSLQTLVIDFPDWRHDVLAGIHEDSNRNGSVLNLSPSCSAPDPWGFCLFQFLQKGRVLTYCPSAVAQAWPIVYSRLHTLFPTIVPFLTTHSFTLISANSFICFPLAESLYRLLWVYMIRIKCESNSATQSRLQSIVNSLFPKGSKAVVPRDTPLNIFVKIIQFIAQERLDFAMREIVFDLLSVGRPIKLILTPERMSIGLRAFLVVADSLQQKEGEPPMPRTSGVLPSGNTLRVKKTYLNKMLTEDTARSIGMSAYFPHVRRVFVDILRALDIHYGRPLMMTSTQNVNKEPDEMITGEHKPRIDLFRTCVAANSNLSNLTRSQVFHQVEGFALVMLCNVRLTPRRLSVHILREVKMLNKVLGCSEHADQNVIDVIDKACPDILDQCMSQLTCADKTAALSASCIDLQWIADRSASIWTAGIHEDSNRNGSVLNLSPSCSAPDPWGFCLFQFLQKGRVLTYCPSAVAQAWPIVYSRLHTLFPTIDPTPVSDNRASLLRSSAPPRKPVSERDSFLSLWRYLAIFSARVVPPVPYPTPRCASPDLSLSWSPENVGGERGGAGVENKPAPTASPPPSPTGLYKLLVPLLRCDTTDVRDAVVHALGNINSEALKDLMEELSVYIREAVDRKTENMRRRRRRDALRLQLVRVFELIAEHGTFGACSPTMPGLLSPLAEYVDGARLCLELEADKQILREIKAHFCNFVCKMIHSFPLESRQTLLKRDLRRNLFSLFTSWAGQYGRNLNITQSYSVSMPNPPASNPGPEALKTSEEELQLTSLSAMSAVLTCGPVFDPSTLLAEDGVLYPWLDMLLASSEEKTYQIGCQTVILLLECNPDMGPLLDWVVDRCYTASVQVADGCFLALATLFSAR